MQVAHNFAVSFPVISSSVENKREMTDNQIGFDVVQEEQDDTAFAEAETVDDVGEDDAWAQPKTDTPGCSAYKRSIPAIRVSIPHDPDLAEFASRRSSGNTYQSTHRGSRFGVDLTSIASLDELSDMSLLYSKHEKLSFRLFPRGSKECTEFEQMVSDLYIILDLQESRADAIMDKMVQMMMHERKDSFSDMIRLRNSFFTHDKLHQLSRTIQTTREFRDHIDYDQNWLCVLCPSRQVSDYRMGFVRLKKPANINRNCQKCKFILAILISTKMVGTPAEFQQARPFSTLLSDPTLRQLLNDARTKEDVKSAFLSKTQELLQIHEPQKSWTSAYGYTTSHHLGDGIHFSFLTGLVGDLRCRLPHYWSDFKDGFRNRKSVAKTMSCTVFLYFICLLPCIAFGVLNDKQTHGGLTVEKVLISQTVGGLIFALIGGTPHIVLLTTVPLAIYAKTVFQFSKKLEVSFPAMYACVGLWNSFFLLIYSIFDFSNVMKYSTRCPEEIFEMFISVAFSVDAGMTAVHNFGDYYLAEQCHDNYNRTERLEALTQAPRNDSNESRRSLEESLPECQRDISMLYLMLMLGTVWVGSTLYNFTRTPYLTATKREMIADYSLPISVIVMTFFGYVVFKDIKVSKSFQLSSHALLRMADLSSLTVGAVFASMGLGFFLSLLFFMDQNITAAVINAPQNRLKKGSAFHWDLLVVAFINLGPSLFTLPMVHAALPHSPLHLRALADVESRVLDGRVTETVVSVRETRMAAILSHLLIGASLTITNYLAYIPRAVLYGLFLYVALIPLYNNQMFERVFLLFTEEAAYPPTYYIRRVPQTKVHLFTFLQLLQLLILCAVGFSGIAYLKMLFPVFIFLLIPFRHYGMPLFVDRKYIAALDHSG